MNSTRIAEELKQWLDVRMASYTDQQYGKGEIRKIMNAILLAYDDENLSKSQPLIVPEVKPRAWLYENVYDESKSFCSLSEMTAIVEPLKITLLYDKKPLVVVSESVKRLADIIRLSRRVGGGIPTEDVDDFLRDVDSMENA